ncbi:tumor necrosis factor alpha-induced protein 2 [Lacerta agilis]|uniref:tumor necrosis factor alpha-induced protein 2 n=1 Tax=Lacerta agilis TaxID=80427 RepID=UPI0014199E92|nr:tumor necrosis factor alpha-induced protein 2 [Lacerta agilis]XP_032995061.1 tumor necrosis factor alpha-induced protein 2 [Lacerta agilis]
MMGMKMFTIFSTSPVKAEDSKPKVKSEVPKPSTSSESEFDSTSIESSTEEAPPKDKVKTESHGLPSKTSVACHCTPEQNNKKKKKRKPLQEKLIGGLMYFALGENRIKPLGAEKDPSNKKESKPVTADQIRELIKDQRFFDASQHLLAMERECSSDSGSKRTEDNVDHQSEIEDLFGLLKQEVLRIIRSSVSIAQAEPELLRDAVRTIAEQVEEDRRCTLEEKASGKAVRCRPRRWKDEWRSTVQESVTDRMKEPLFDSNEGLSTTAHSFLHMGKTMKDDLITVVKYIKCHYPEDFQVCSTYAQFYHRCFSSQLEMVAQFELGRKDTYLLLTWVQNIYPNEIINHPILAKDLDKAHLESLLPLRQIKQFEAAYLTNEVDAAKRSLANCLQLEVKKWAEGNKPPKLAGHYHSELHIDAIQIIHNKQKEAEGITTELAKQMSTLVFEELLTFLKSYKKALDIFMKEKKNQYFEATVITNMNSCLGFRSHAEKTPGQDYIRVKIVNALSDIETAGCDVLVQCVVQELQPIFRKFTQRKWASCTDIIDEIIATARHHVSTLRALKDPLRQAVIEKIHFFLVQEYISRLMKKKVSLRTPELQKNLSELVQQHASILCTFCLENGSNAKWLGYALPSLAEIIKLQGTDTVMVEVGMLASKYPDISKKHLSAILYIKGNLSSNETRSILSVLDIGVTATLPHKHLFSTIRV